MNIRNSILFSCVMALLVFACSGSGNDGGDDGGDGGITCAPENEHTISYGPKDETFFVGPYLGFTTTTSVMVSWETEQSGSSKVEFGPDDSLGSSAQAEPGTMHHVVIDGLEPATSYHYRACSDDRCTSDLTFSTAPLPGQPFRFAVYGDTRSDPSKHGEVSSAIVSQAPVLVIDVGDIVADGRNREEFKQMHFDPTRLMGHYAPLLVSIGNHERKDFDAVHFKDYLDFPSDSLDGFPKLEERQAGTTFSFTFGDAFFIILDDTLDHADLFFPLDGVDSPLWLWLQHQVSSPEAQRAKWRFAFAHYPADSACYKDADYGWPSSEVRAQLLPLLWANGFHAYFAGHQHDYERFDFQGHLVITTGGGGASLEDEESCVRKVDELRVLKSVYHYVTVDLLCDKAVVTATDLDGNVFDQLVIHPDGTREEVE